MTKSEGMRSGGESVAFGGVECDVTTPFFMPDEAPSDCIAVGRQSTNGTEPCFAISTLAEGGFAMVGHLDWPSYKKLARLILSIGEEAMQDCSVGTYDASLSAAPANFQRFVNQLHTLGCDDDAQSETCANSFQMTIRTAAQGPLVARGL